MSELSKEQAEKRDSIHKSALIWGCIGGGIVGLIALWALGSQGAAIRFGGAAVLGAGVGFGLFRMMFNSGAKSAQCGKCGAAFSISRTDRQEKVLGSEAKETREEQEDKSTKVTTWTEEAYEVTETFTCAKCGDVSTKTHKSSRRKDETSAIEAAVVGVAAAAMAAPAEDEAEDGAPKAMSGASAEGSTSSLGAGKDKYGKDADGGDDGKATLAKGKKKAEPSEQAADDPFAAPQAADDPFAADAEEHAEKSMGDGDPQAGDTSTLGEGKQKG